MSVHSALARPLIALIMNNSTEPSIAPVAIVTGSARRIGSVTVRTLHAAGYNVVVHCGSSVDDANTLIENLNISRAESAIVVQADLRNNEELGAVIDAALQRWSRLDVLVNNASTFYPTPVGSITQKDIDDLFATNLLAPLVLSQAASTALAEQRGCIINMIDTHAYRPHRLHSVYCAAKAGLLSVTRSLALELAPHVRVNGVAPGSILWPEGDASLDADAKQQITDEIPMGRNGTPQDIANLIRFLCSEQANYITGQIISVDGGRSL